MIFIKRYAVLLILVIFAFALDIAGGLGAKGFPGLFGAPSLFTVIYLVGISAALRALVKSRFGLSAAWAIVILQFTTWFLIMTIVTNLHPYRPSVLAFLSLYAGFSTLRRNESPGATLSTD